MRGRRYTVGNQIGQFVTILSVNKTRTLDGRNAPIFYGWVRSAPIFILEEIP